MYQVVAPASSPCEQSMAPTLNNTHTMRALRVVRVVQEGADGWFPIHSAADQGTPDILSLLLLSGADPNVLDPQVCMRRATPGRWLTLPVTAEWTRLTNITRWYGVSAGVCE